MEGAIDELGTPLEHHFWGSTATIVMPSDYPDIKAKALGAINACERLHDHCAQVAQTLGLTAPTDLAEISCLDNALQLLHRRPGLGDLDPESTLWEEKAELLQELIGKGRAFHKLHAEHDKALIPEAWGADVLEARRALLDVGNQWWRFVTPRFWRARSFVRALCKKDAPTTHQNRLAILDAISEARALAADLDAEATLLEEVLRSSWKRKRTQWKFVGLRVNGV